MLKAKDHFDYRSRVLEGQDHERKKWFIAAKHFKEQKELQHDQTENALDNLAAAVVMADPIKVKAFKVELDTYDALTIEAIMENREILDRLYRERETMLNNAYQLEDGTRVFKSVDGKNVYDEHKNLLSKDAVDANEIPDHHPKAEPFFEKERLIEKHEAINNRLTSYQEKLDAARERLDEGDLTQEEFDNLREDLKVDMPIEVRRKLPDYDPAQETNLKSDFVATTKKLVLSPEDMRIDPSMDLGIN